MSGRRSTRGKTPDTFPDGVARGSKCQVLWGKQGWFDATVSGMEKGALLVDFDDGSEGTVAANQIVTRFRLAGTADSEDVQVTATKGAKKAKAKKKEEKAPAPAPAPAPARGKAKAAPAPAPAPKAKAKAAAKKAKAPAPAPAPAPEEEEDEEEEEEEVEAGLDLDAVKRACLDGEGASNGVEDTINEALGTCLVPLKSGKNRGKACGGRLVFAAATGLVSCKKSGAHGGSACEAPFLDTVRSAIEEAGGHAKAPTAAGKARSKPSAPKPSASPKKGAKAPAKSKSAAKATAAAKSGGKSGGKSAAKAPAKSPARQASRDGAELAQAQAQADRQATSEAEALGEEAPGSGHRWPAGEQAPAGCTWSFLTGEWVDADFISAGQARKRRKLEERPAAAEKSMWARVTRAEEEEAPVVFTPLVRNEEFESRLVSMTSRSAGDEKYDTFDDKDDY